MKTCQCKTSSLYPQTLIGAFDAASPELTESSPINIDEVGTNVELIFTPAQDGQTSQVGLVRTKACEPQCEISCIRMFIIV